MLPKGFDPTFHRREKYFFSFLRSTRTILPPSSIVSQSSSLRFFFLPQTLDGLAFFASSVLEILEKEEVSKYLLSQNIHMISERLRK